MIDFIDGEIVYITPAAVVVKAGGIGYRVISANPYAFGSEGEKARIFTYQYIREDVMALYGFKTKQERELFCQLLDVSGIGPKGALAVIGSGHPAEVVQAIYEENIRFLTRLPGIGKKTAQRIILDLKDKLELDVWLNDVIDTGRPIETQRAAKGDPGPAGEAIEALIHLGYNEKEAKRAVAEALQASSAQDLPVDELIRKALKTFL